MTDLVKPTKITIRCVNCSPNAHYATAEDEHGIVVAEWTCSSHDWIKHDLGLTSTRQHDIYNKKYPEGWKLINRIGM